MQTRQLPGPGPGQTGPGQAGRTLVLPECLPFWWAQGGQKSPHPAETMTLADTDFATSCWILHPETSAHRQATQWNPSETLKKNPTKAV
jgi:hypothetical protein